GVRADADRRLLVRRSGTDRRETARDDRLPRGTSQGDPDGGAGGSECVIVPGTENNVPMNFGSTVMSTRIDDHVLSQLADGELPPDETVAALQAALDDEDSREKLSQHLQLRQMSAAWRSQTPSRDLLPAVPAPNCTPLSASLQQERPRRHASASGVLVASV